MQAGDGAIRGRSLSEVGFDLVQPRFARLPVRTGELRVACDLLRLLRAAREVQHARAPRPEIGGLCGETGDIRWDEPKKHGCRAGSGDVLATVVQQAKGVRPGAMPVFQTQHMDEGMRPRESGKTAQKDGEIRRVVRLELQSGRAGKQALQVSDHGSAVARVIPLQDDETKTCSRNTAQPSRQAQ